MRSVLATLILMASVGLVIAGGAALPAREDIPKYVKTIASKSSSAKAKTEAVNMIAKRGQIFSRDVEDAIEPLKTLAKSDSDAGVRKSAVVALGSIAPTADDTVPLLIQILKTDKSQDVKFATVAALGKYGPKAQAALPAIRDFGKDLDKKQKNILKSATQAISGNRK